MKKWLSALLALSLLCFVVSCGPDDSGEPEVPKDDDTDEIPTVGPENDPAVPDIDWGLPT